MTVERKNVVLLFCIIISLIYTGCTVPPAKREIQDIIVRYFQTRGYEIREITIKKIDNIPMRDRQYMSAKGYLIRLSSITLQPTEPTDGRVLTYSDIVIEIQRSIDPDRRWNITNISGIPVP